MTFHPSAAALEGSRRPSNRPKTMEVFSLKATLLNVVIAVLIALPALFLNTIAEPYERGFYCGDPVIRHPYKVM